MERMDLTRRGFVVAGSVCMAGLLVGCGAGGAFTPDAASATGAAGSGSTFTGPPVGGHATLAALTLDSFDRIVGDHLQMTDGETTADVTVLETVDHQDLNDEAPELGTREPFSVVFEGPAEFCPQEGRYEITHPEFGTVEVFMLYMGPQEVSTVVGSTIAKNRYEVHFN